MLERSLVLLIYFGAGLAGLFAAGQIARPGRDPRRRVLALLLLCLGAIQGHAGLFHSGDIEFVPYLFLINVPALFFCGPLLAAYLRVVSQQSDALRPIHFMHLLPGVLASAYLAGFIIFSDASRLDLIQATRNLSGGYPADLRLIFILALASALLYSLYGLRVLFALARAAAIKSEFRRPLWLLFLMFCFVGLLGNVAFILRSVFLIQLTYAGLSVILVSLYFISLRYPDMLLEAARELRRRPELVRLRRVDTARMHARLLELMEDERLYRDENLSLDHLAAMLRLSPEQLSQYLNGQLGKNFSAFINEYRVREASELLRAEPARTVLDIAYAVGFNSSSVFHEAFRRFTGQSPGRYRKGATK